MKRICYIVSAGDCTGINIIKNKEDYIIAADGGYKYVEEHGIVPDMILGDFDSLGFVPEGENVIVHKPEKDDTDTMLAVREGIKLGYSEFVFFGALGGGRLDHTIANLQVLIYLSKRGMKGKIVDKNVEITAVTNGRISLPYREKGIFSVFTFDERAEGVTIKNAKYEIEDVTVTNDVPLGISNEFVGNEPLISVANGTLIILWQTDSKNH